MNPEKKAEWTAALRSGRYRQGTAALRPVRERFCCLGVACDVINPHAWSGPDQGFWGIDNADSVLPSYARDVLGLDTDAGDFLLPDGLVAADYGQSELSLAGLNDAGFTFDQIADVIDYFF